MSTDDEAGEGVAPPRPRRRLRLRCGADPSARGDACARDWCLNRPPQIASGLVLFAELVVRVEVEEVDERAVLRLVEAQRKRTQVDGDVVLRLAALLGRLGLAQRHARLQRGRREHKVVQPVPPRAREARVKRGTGRQGPLQGLRVCVGGSHLDWQWPTSCWVTSVSVSIICRNSRTLTSLASSTSQSVSGCSAFQ